MISRAEARALLPPGRCVLFVRRWGYVPKPEGWNCSRSTVLTAPLRSEHDPDRIIILHPRGHSVILFNPLGRTAPATRVVDSVFVIMNCNDLRMANLGVPLTLRSTEPKLWATTRKRWGLYEWYEKDCEYLLFDKPHTCVGENECA